MTRKIKNIKNQELTILSSAKKGVSNKAKIKYLKKFCYYIEKKNIFAAFLFCNVQQQDVYIQNNNTIIRLETY